MKPPKTSIIYERKMRPEKLHQLIRKRSLLGLTPKTAGSKIFRKRVRAGPEKSL